MRVLHLDASCGISRRTDSSLYFEKRHDEIQTTDRKGTRFNSLAVLRHEQNDLLERPIADRATGLVRDEETLSVREVRVRSSVKRDTDWTVNISLRWHDTRLDVSQLARRGIGKVGLCIHFSTASLSRVMYEHMCGSRSLRQPPALQSYGLDRGAAVPFPDPAKCFTREFV